MPFSGIRNAGRPKPTEYAPEMGAVGRRARGRGGAEAGAGDPDTARARIEALQTVTLLDAPMEAGHLAQTLLDTGALPRRAAGDAAHIAVAAANGADYLVTWNFRHIANAAMRSRIERACRQAGFEPPAICTPGELTETGHGDGTD